MSGYEFALAAHVVAAVVWVGGAAAIQLLAFRVLARNEPAEISRFTGDAEFIGLRVFMPASLLVIVAGGWMVYDGPWRLDDPWVAIALALFVLSFLTGMGFLGPESGRISKLVAEHGEAHPEVLRRIRRILLVSRIELVWLVAIVLLMAIKPG